MIGKTIGSYEVVATLGAGGMGEVYRARDTKLGRDIALKVLPEMFVGDPERVARFEREAKTLASLNHPNIAHIYDAGSYERGAYLAMELVEGDDLSQRIARGVMPLDEALAIARQVAEALEAAHEQGIIHRDLKPANVKVRADGTVKVLDFGLAKAVEGDGSRLREQDPSPWNSPTLTARMTQMGVILGTAAYMAPEQAKGKPVDKRADIWAFGVVLHEMLTRQHLFMADTIPETLAHVMTRQVDLATLPETTPIRVRNLLARCLEKDPKRRLRDIGEARLVLDSPALAAPEAAASAAAGAPVPPKVPRWQRIVPWTLAAAGLGAALVLWAPWRTSPAVAPTKLLANTGADASLLTSRGAAAVLSPDGTTLAFVARVEGQAWLYIRKLDQLQAVALAGTEGAESPFFSPTSEWVAFFAGGQLKKVQVTGGAVVTLCDAPAGRGGTWAEDDTIVFTPMTGLNVKLQRVSGAGGAPVAVGGPQDTATTRRWPQVLPGGTHVLFTEHTVAADFDTANLVVAPLDGGPSKVVVERGYSGRYAPSGHLIYMRQGSLFAVPFDLERLEPTGQPVPAVEGIMANPATGSAQFAFSAVGTFVHVPGAATESNIPIHWMTRDGRSSPLRQARMSWAEPRFSPDGQRLALAVSDGKQEDIWVYEWARDTMTQLTFDPARDRTPVWSPDGDRILFSSSRANPSGPTNLYVMNADGTGEVTRLTDSPQSQVAFSWHPGGRFIFFQQNNPDTSWDLLVLPLDGDARQGWKAGAPTVFLATPATELYPKVSPDGRWVAYFETSVASVDVFVRPFPGPGGQWRISTGGGYFPTWSQTTPELLFPSPNSSAMMVSRYAVAGDSFRADSPEPWGAVPLGGLGQTDRYTLHPDGKRLAASPAESESGVMQDELVFIFNFFDYLRSIAPTRKR